MTDEAIMIEVKAGQIRKSALLFERYQIGIYNYFLQRTQDASLSEDMTQTVFERMIKYRHTFRQDSRFKGWLFTIAKNVRADHYRSQKIKTTGIESAYSLEMDEENMQERLEALDDSSKFKRAFQAMDDAYREVLYLTRFQEMKYKDAARLLQCTEGTVKSKVHRAINQLKQIYFQIP